MYLFIYLRRMFIYFYFTLFTFFNFLFSIYVEFIRVGESRIKKKDFHFGRLLLLVFFLLLIFSLCPYSLFL